METPTPPKSNITISPEPHKTDKLPLFTGNRGLIIAIIVVLAAVAIGFFTFGSGQSAEQYQGLIQEIEKETEQLNQNSAIN